jgi:hypothetical protein
MLVGPGKCLTTELVVPLVGRVQMALTKVSE